MKSIKKFTKLSKVSALALGLFVATMAIVYGLNVRVNGSPEISLASFSVTDAGKGAVMAASCYWNSGVWSIADGAYNGDRPNGVPAQQIYFGITPQPQCAATCPSGTVAGPNGTCAPGICTNGATNFPACNNNICTNGAVNAPACNVCSSTSFYYNTASRSCVPNECAPGNRPSNYGATCSGGTNACGQGSTGTIKCDGTCSVSVNTNNNTCITGFNVNTSSVIPNGSAEFSWKTVGDPKDVLCSFYDRSRVARGSNDKGTPIQGLQNLPIGTDRLRINNIQRTTEFCLYCAYQSDVTTPAAAHQWVRVIRIGEN
jgi:hypothetical protein